MEKPDWRKLRDEEFAERKAQRKREREEQRQRDQKVIEEEKLALSQLYNIPIDKYFNITWDIAWDHGHSDGLAAVERYFVELIPLLRRD